MNIKSIFLTALLVLSPLPVVAQDISNPSGVSQVVDDWVPELIGSSTSGSQTYSVQYGNYVKTGTQVTANFELRLASITATGNILLTNLPFTSANVNGGSSTPGTCNVAFYQGFTFSAGTTQLSVQVRPNSTTADIYTGGSAVSTASQAISGLTSNAYITGTCTYRTAS